jgi:hypothetical protein
MRQNVRRDNMKQHIDARQWECLSEVRQQRLTPWLLGTGGLTTVHYSRFWTIGRSIDFIRHHHQMDIYTVNKEWCVQLFDLGTCANDAQSCIYENSSKELIDALYECMLWILDRLEE